MRADLVDVIEACYRPAASDDAWLGAVLVAVRPALGPRGVMGHFFQAADPARARAWGAQSVGCPDALKDHMLGMFEEAPPEAIDQVFRRPKSGVTASQLLGRKA